MDPLQLLRQFTVERKEIKEDGDRLIFGDLSCPRKAETNYKTHKGEYYDVETLHFLLKNIELDQGPYIVAARRAKVPAVPRVDRRDLLSFLTGQVEDSVHIDKGKFAAPVAERVAEKRPASDASAAAAAAAGSTGADSADAAGITQLSDTLTPEVIAELRAKKRRKEAAADASDAGAAGEDTSDLTAEITGRELVYETRTSVLQAMKSDLSSAIRLLQRVNRNEQSTNRGRSSSSKPAAQKTYDRYHQAGQKEDSGDFNINVKGSYMPGTLLTSGSSSQSKSKEKEEAKRPHKRTSRTPIIFVPSSTATMITLYNIKQFVEEGKFEHTQNFIQRGAAKPHNVVINRKRDGKTVATYRVVDNPAVLKPAEWERVVCVFVAGPEWQFRSWPMLQSGGTVVDVFAQIRGFHCKWESDPIQPSIKAWDVAVLGLSRNKRHLDMTSVYKFWEILDVWTRNKHPKLRT